MEVRSRSCHRPRARSRAQQRCTKHQEEALRRFWCARCGRAVLVCRFCDRGQIYCALGCAQRSRRESLRRAGARYQGTRPGRRHHAARQSQYRRRQREKVTHQGPQKEAAAAQGSCVAHSAPKEDQDDEPKPDDRPAEPPGPQDGEASPPPQRVAQERSAAQVASLPHICHFCQRTRSAWTRRQRLVVLRRRRL